MRMTHYLWIAAILACMAAVPTAAKAQQYPAGEMPNMVTISEASYSDIMTRLESLETSLADEKKKDDGWKDVSSEKWVSKFNGRFMIDYANFAAQNDVSRQALINSGQGGPTSVAPGGDAQDFVDFRRMYIGFEGEGYGIYEYKFEVDLSPAFGVRNAAGNATTLDGPVQLKDIYFGIKEVPVLGTVLVGHFKAPMSLEELTSSRFISFMERASVNAFVPSREVGAAAYNKNATETARIGYGVFFDNVDEIGKQRESDNQGITLIGRGSWTPYYDEPSKGRYLIHTGAAWRYTDDHDNLVNFSPREEVGLGPRWTSTGNITADDFNVLNLEGAAVWGPVSVQSEFFYVPVSATNGTDYDFYGAYAYASWFLTGENRNYRRDRGTFDRVSPNSNFWLVRGAGMGPGAVEAVARWDYLDLSGTGANPTSGSLTTNPLSGMQNDLTLGINWYWNPNVRWMFNYIHAWNDYDSGALAGSTAENDILAASARVDW